MFGAPIGRSAEKRASTGVAASKTRHAEVRKFYAAFAVDDAFAMRYGETGGDIADPSAGARKGNRSFF
ncbi:MAG: hypothetical protein NVS9B14_13980 [Candidatus Acidiferrum sp.]